MSKLRIALVGPAGCGKGTVADIMVRHFKFTRLSFADPIRQYVCSLLVESRDRWDRIKDKPHDMLDDGMTPRDLAIALSTPLSFTCAVKRVVAFSSWLQKNVVVDDLRTIDEAHALREEGYTLVWLARPGYGIANSMEGLVGFSDCDVTLDNNTDIDGLKERVFRFFIAREFDNIKRQK